jgi:hypothetical protein
VVAKPKEALKRKNLLEVTVCRYRLRTRSLHAAQSDPHGGLGRLTKAATWLRTQEPCVIDRITPKPHTESTPGLHIVHPSS